MHVLRYAHHAEQQMQQCMVHSRLGVLRGKRQVWQGSLSGSVSRKAMERDENQKKPAHSPRHGAKHASLTARGGTKTHRAPLAICPLPPAPPHIAVNFSDSGLSFAQRPTTVPKFGLPPFTYPWEQLRSDLQPTLSFSIASRTRPLT